MKKMIGGYGWIGKSTEEKPTVETIDGEPLYLVDTKESFVWYEGQWWDA